MYTDQSIDQSIVDYWKIDFVCLSHFDRWQNIPKKFHFSWRHTSSCFINIHDYVNYTTPTHTYSKLGYIITQHMEIACVHRSINRSINSRLLENWFCLSFSLRSLKKKFLKKFQFSWRHTSLLFMMVIIIHDGFWIFTTMQIKPRLPGEYAN